MKQIGKFDGQSIWKKTPISAILSILLPMGISAPLTAQEEGVQILEELIVTARKTEESLQDTPVAVTAFTAEDIFNSGIQNIEDISRQTPGFVFDTPFGRQFDRPIIRGQANILGASGVSVFIDGVNVTQSIRSLNFGDVERIEIIKGPQSALFGRNTYSGAINITSRQPSNETKGDVSLEVGEHGLVQVLGNVSGAIAEDKLFYSLAGRYYEFDSEFDQPDNLNPSVGNESSNSLSATIKAALSENWNVTLRASYNEDDDGHFPIGLLGFDSLNVNVPGGTELGGPQPFYRGVVETQDPNPSGSSQLSKTLGEGGGIEREETFFALNSEYEFGSGYSLFATLGYTKEEFKDELDSDGQPGSFATASVGGPFPLGPPGAPFGVLLLPFDFTTTDNDTQETQVAELRIDSPQEASTRWRLGGYYFKNEAEDRDLLGRFADGRFEQAARDSFDRGGQEIAAAIGQPFVVDLIPFSYGPSNPALLETENVSVFGSISHDFSDRLSASAEIRWAKEEIDQFFFNQDESMVTFSQNEEFTAVTPRLTIDYQRTDDQLLYGIIAQGTKPGGFNSEAAQDVGFGSFEEEDSTTLELGSKNVIADGRGVLNATVFYSEIEGYQLTENLAALGVTGTTGSATANLGEVRIYGLELETSFIPSSIPGLELGGSYAYTNAEFTEGQENTQELVFGNSSLDGQEIPRQAPHQLSFYGDYSFAASETMDGLFSLNGSYLDSRFAQVQNLAETGSSFELDARLTLKWAEDKYSVSLWGKNLTDEDAALGVLRFIDALGVNSYTVAGQPIPSVFELGAAGQSRGFQYNNRNGRRFGVTFRARF